MELEGSTEATSPVPVTGNDDRRETLYVGVTVSRDTMEQSLFAAAAAQRATAGREPLALFGATLLELAQWAEGQLFQDVFALFFNERKHGGSFVEVGTGDGKTISNTYLLEKRFGWSGLVVEPNPAFHASIAAHRTCAVAFDCVLDVSGRQVVFQCLEEPEFSGIALSGSTVSEDMHVDKRHGASRDLTLTTISLNDLLDRQAVTAPLDFLSVDVEGPEFLVLKTFDFGRWRPRCVTVEHNWHRSRADVYDLMMSNGYVRVFCDLSQWDDWYVDRDYLASRPEWGTYLAELDGPTSDQQARMLLTWAQEAIARDALPVASSLCLASLDQNDRISATYRTLADIAQRQGRQTVALDRWSQAIAVDQDDYWARIGLANLLEVRGDADRATVLLNEAVAAARSAGDSQAIEMTVALLARFAATTATVPSDKTPRQRRSDKTRTRRSNLR